MSGVKNKITDYTIKAERTDAGTGSFRALFITDLHNASWNNDRDYLPSLIKRSRPDIILCGGDMIVAHPKKSVDAGLYFMHRMLDIAPVCFSLGNHEFRSRIYPETYGTMYEDFMNPLLDRGMILLENEKAEVSINGVDVAVYGLAIPKENYRRFEDCPLLLEKIESLVGRPDEKQFSILLAHNPKYSGVYFQWGADLTLCGHYHGGVVGIGKNKGLISPGFDFLPSNARGRITENGKDLIISAGLGEHTIPVRINNPRELVCIDIKAGL